MVIDRRQLLIVTAALTGGIVPQNTRPGSLLDEVDADLERLWASYGARDVATTARLAGLQLRTLTAIQPPRLSDAASQELLAAQARVGALRARALIDAGQLRAGRQAADLAAARATRAGDRHTTAHALATRAAAALFADDPDAAIRAATVALQATPGDPRLLVVSARAFAQSGNVPHAIGSLDSAQRALDRRGAPVTGPAAPGTMSRLEFARAAVDVHARSGLTKRAREIAREMTDAVPRELAEDTKLALGASVAVGLARIDPDEGAATLSRSLEVSATMGRPARAAVERVIAFTEAADPEQRAVHDLVALLEAVDV